VPSSVNVKISAYSFPYGPIAVVAVLRACMMQVCASGSCVSCRTLACSYLSQFSGCVGVLLGYEDVYREVLVQRLDSFEEYAVLVVGHGCAVQAGG